MAQEPDVRWGVAQRFEFIEWRVFWEGRLNRGDLEREFAISTPQASVDLRNYQAIAPGNIAYDSGEKAYVLGADFRPTFLKLSGRKFLEQLRGIKESYVSIDDTWFSEIFATALPERIQKWPEEFVLQSIVSCIKNRKMVSINYTSLTKTAERKIAPHALVFDGVRWHARAWCFKNEEYRDFVLGRILSVGQKEDWKEELPIDTGWETKIDITICPHPDLEVHQKEAISHDFMMENGERTVVLQACLAFYFVRRFNLDLRGLPILPQRLQIVMKDYEGYCTAMRAIGMTP